MSIPLTLLPIEDEIDIVEQINIRSRIIRHMALAFFGSAWADWMDNYGAGCPGGVDVMDIMPDDMDPEALRAAYDLAEALEKAAGADLPEILVRAQANVQGGSYDCPCDEEHFGHYCAMQAMGHGVGIESVGLDHDWIEIPDIEFTPFNLDPGQYPIPD